MTKLTYVIVEHDGGWAYRVNETYSESFPSHDEARRAAQAAAEEQARPGDTLEISFEDAQGQWHTETSSGKDRPEVDVEG